MSTQIVTHGIVLSRREYQEADRILTVLTPDHGKISLIAKGVRKPKSKLAGGIELFSVSELTFLPGRSDLKTLVSSRLLQHYGEIVKDINRTMLGYDCMKQIGKILEDSSGGEYFELLKSVLVGLNDLDLPKEVVEIWFNIHLLQMTGHAPNLRTDNLGKLLETGKSYVFSFDEMTFSTMQDGESSTDLIKYLRLASVSATTASFGQVQASEDLRAIALQMTSSMVKYTLRV